MPQFMEPASIDTVLGVFTKTLAKLEKRADWLTDQRSLLEDELVRVKAQADRHSVEQTRIGKARTVIREIVGG